ARLLHEGRRPVPAGRGRHATATYRGLKMPATEHGLTPGEIARARAIWAEYQSAHDRVGRAVGIDPATGEVWLGDSIVDIVEQRKAKGSSSPLVFERIGYPAYFRKGGRR
ncbi:MAG TPA: hypothetical protein VF170_16400, partial [Planctomycetaceae bacterium]